MKILRNLFLLLCVLCLGFSLSCQPPLEVLCKANGRVYPAGTTIVCPPELGSCCCTCGWKPESGASFIVREDSCIPPFCEAAEP